MTQAGCALLGPDHPGAPWFDASGCPRFAVWWGWGGFFGAVLESVLRETGWLLMLSC
jgi:hypothetical protein